MININTYLLIIRSVYRQIKPSLIILLIQYSFLPDLYIQSRLSYVTLQRTYMKRSHMKGSLLIQSTKTTCQEKKSPFPQWNKYIIIKWFFLFHEFYGELLSVVFFLIMRFLVLCILFSIILIRKEGNFNLWLKGIKMDVEEKVLIFGL